MNSRLETIGYRLEKFNPAPSPPNQPVSLDEMVGVLPIAFGPTFNLRLRYSEIAEWKAVFYSAHNVNSIPTIDPLESLQLGPSRKCNDTGDDLWILAITDVVFKLSRKGKTANLVDSNAINRLKLDEAMQFLSVNQISKCRKTTYGFSIGLDGRFIECGIEVLGNVSMSIRDDQWKVQWYARFDFLELAHLIVSAFEIANSPYTRGEICNLVRKLDSDYYHIELDHWRERKVAELEFKSVQNLEE